MPILRDARVLLEIDRERVELAERAQAVNEQALATAQELVRIGDQERPKAAAFIDKVQGATLPTLSALTSSSGGGGGAGGGAGAAGGGGSRVSGPRTLTSQAGGYRQREDWIRTECKLIPGGIEIPNPGNPSAMAVGDYVKVAAWDCGIPMGLPAGEAVFLDPDAMDALRPGRSSSSGSGGGSRGGGRPAGRGGGNELRDNPGRVPMDDPTRVPGSSSSGVSVGSSTAPTADGKLLEKTFREVGRAIVAELRASSGDLGLQIRRNGGL